MLTRRRILTAFPAGVVAGPAPALASEEIASKVQRLSRELSDALDEWGGGSFKAIVHPAGHPAGQMELLRCDLPIEEELRQCARQAARLLTGGPGGVVIVATQSDTGLPIGSVYFRGRSVLEL